MLSNDELVIDLGQRSGFRFRVGGRGTDAASDAGRGDRQSVRRRAGEEGVDLTDTRIEAERHLADEICLNTPNESDGHLEQFGLFDLTDAGDRTIVGLQQSTAGQCVIVNDSGVSRIRHICQADAAGDASRHSPGSATGNRYSRYFKEHSMKMSNRSSG